MLVFDPIHGSISICQKAKAIIDTPEYQRLRNISQLGGIYHVWTGGSHNRFEHSIGVYHLSKLYMDIINKQGKYFSDNHKTLISIGALIHDLGHGPFSHLFDDWLNIISSHEERSIEIFKYMNDKYGFGYSDYDINFIKNVISPDYEDIEMTDNRTYLYQIVSSSNGIDVDRFDYILRDCHNTGIKYSFEFDHIINNTHIVNNELMYSYKAKCSIDSYFNTRYIIYKQVCNHPTVISVEHHIKEALTEIDSVMNISESIKKKDWEKYCKFTDEVLGVVDFMNNNLLDKASEIINNIKCRSILKLVGSITSNEEKHIVSTNMNIVVIKTKIKYHSHELPKYISDKNIKISLLQHHYPDEYITFIMCKEKNNIEANELFNLISDE